MTDREKAIVMAYTGYAMLTGDKLGLYYKYIQEIVGRPVMTHELAEKPMQETIHTLSKPDFVELCRTNDEPRVLTLEEMKSLSTANDDALFDKDMTFVWLEAAADGYINITRPTYSFNPEYGDEDDSFYVYYIGTDVGDRLRSCDYGKTWRCWNTRPTDEQREATPWNEPPKEGDGE